jgi:uncharacterized membrane protein
MEEPRKDEIDSRGAAADGAERNLVDDGRRREGFHTAMVHLYRGEMQRMTAWRTRLDTTTNWAILLTTGLTTFTLGQPGIPHYILLLVLALETICLYIEGRRYQDFHASRCRVRLLERGYFAAMVGRPEAVEEEGFRDTLLEDLRRPRRTIGLLLACRVRLRRNYLLLLYFVTAVWLTKVFTMPRAPSTLGEFFSRLAVGDLLPPTFVAVTATAFILGGTALALATPDEDSLDGGRCRRRDRL